MPELTYYDEKKHLYFYNGVSYPSVTEILRFANCDISANADRYARDRAAERGTAIHEACMLYDFEGEELVVDNSILPFVKSYAAFVEDYKPDWILREKRMLGEINVQGDCFGKNMIYGGTIDRVGFVDEKLVLVDIKTGTKLNVQAVLAQCAAYAAALKIPIDGIAVLALKDSGYVYTFHPVDSEEFAHGLELFRRCYGMHIILEEGKIYGRTRNKTI